MSEILISNIFFLIFFLSCMGVSAYQLIRNHTNLLGEKSNVWIGIDKKYRTKIFIFIGLVLLIGYILQVIGL